MQPNRNDLTAPLVGGSAAEDRPAASRSRWGTVVFQLGGVVLTGLGFVAGVVGLVFLAIVGTYCAAEPPPSLVRDVKVGFAVLTLGVAFMPSMWALVSWRAGRAWQPWAVLAGVILVPGLLISAFVQPVLSGPLGSYCPYVQH